MVLPFVRLGSGPLDEVSGGRLKGPQVGVATGTSFLSEPINSSFDECLGRRPLNDAISPASQYVFMGVLRDGTNAPVPGVHPLAVQLEIEAPCMNPVVIHPIGASNSQGEVFWDASSVTLPGGSCAAECVVSVVVMALLFACIDDVRSPDHAALPDLIVFQQPFVSQAPAFEGDLDCNDTIALADLVRFQEHFVAGQR